LFAVYTVLLPLLRVNNAFGLALAAGALEFLPVIGPVASSVLIILVALFQDSTAFGLTTVQYGLLVTLCVVAVQQIESNIIVPRIIGNSLRLHPVVVLLSVLMGTSLAGVLGAVLAAPVMASAKLVVTYAWYRVLDQPLAFLDETEQEDPEPPRRWFGGPALRRAEKDDAKNEAIQDEEATVSEPRVPGEDAT
jgi:predicted PurR-regulated permease PerM